MITERCPPPGWDECEAEPGHAFLGSLAERLDHLIFIAPLDDDDAVPVLPETDELRQLLRELKLTDWETLHVRAAAQGPEAVGDRSEGLRFLLHRIALVSNRMSFAHSHGEFSEGERERIRAMARALEIDDAQVDALEEHYQRVRALKQP